MGKRLLHFIVYSNLFIAACALALTIETFYLLHLSSFLYWYLFLIFLCTAFVYSLHYFVKSKKDKTGSRLEWCRKNRQILPIVILVSFMLIAGTVIYHYPSIFEKNGRFNYFNLAWFIIIPLLALGYSYPLNPWNKKSLRQIGWLKMASLSFIWSFTTVVLPVLMFPTANTGYAGNNYVVILFIHRFFFIAALSLLFNINDYAEDKKDGIKTIAVLIGPLKSLRYGKWVMTVLNVAAAFLLLYYFELLHPIYFAALLLPVVLLFLLFHRFLALKDEALFVIRYDGLMIVKALLLIFAVLTG